LIIHPALPTIILGFSKPWSISIINIIKISLLVLEVCLIRLNEILHVLIREKKMKGIFAGIIAGIAGALVWAIVAYFTGFEIGWLAWGVGALVGAAVAWGSEGTQTTGVVAVIITVIAIIAGKPVSTLPWRFCWQKKWIMSASISTSKSKKMNI
jgi:hypothetical protein